MADDFLKAKIKNGKGEDFGMWEAKIDGKRMTTVCLLAARPGEQ